MWTRWIPFHFVAAFLYTKRGKTFNTKTNCRIIFLIWNITFDEKKEALYTKLLHKLKNMWFTTNKHKNNFLCFLKISANTFLQLNNQCVIIQIIFLFVNGFFLRKKYMNIPTEKTHHTQSKQHCQRCRSLWYENMIYQIPC